ncbi:MAG: hypothetical protein ACE5PT_10565 [Gemmatimonadales bacterium]
MAGQAGRQVGACEIRPFEEEGSGLRGRLRRLEDRGVLVRARGRKAPLRLVARKRGALGRFLSERDD